MKKVKKILLAILIVLIFIQFIQPARNESGQVLPTDIERTYSIPHDITVILKNACYDCHSNYTRYPWYVNVQPAAWLLANHIKNGKAQLKFSDFGSYSPRRQQSKLKSIASQVNDGAMPLSSYMWIHKNARLSEAEKLLIISWMQKTADSIMAHK
jgi:hypothetical protein